MGRYSGIKSADPRILIMLTGCSSGVGKSSYRSRSGGPKNVDLEVRTVPQSHEVQNRQRSVPERVPFVKTGGNKVTRYSIKYPPRGSGSPTPSGRQRLVYRELKRALPIFVPRFWNSLCRFAAATLTFRHIYTHSSIRNSVHKYCELRTDVER